MEYKLFSNVTKKMIGIIAYLIIGIAAVVVSKRMFGSYVLDGKKMLEMGIIMFFSYCLAMLIHEFAHYICFLKLKIRACSVLGITVIKSDNKTKININPRNFFRGGWVLPQIPYEIDSEETYLYYKHRYCISVIMGPIVSMLFIVVLLGIKIIFRFGSIIDGLIFFYSMHAIGINLAAVGYEGDYYKYYVYRSRDKKFFYDFCRDYNIMQYKKQNLTAWLNKRLRKEIENDLTIRKGFLLSSSVAYAVDIIILRFLIYQEPLGDIVERYLFYLIQNIQEIDFDKVCEEQKIMLIHMLYYLKYIDDEKWKKIVNICESLFDDAHVGVYYKKQIRAFCYQENYSDFWLCDKNIKTSSNWEIEQLLDTPQYTENCLFNLLITK